ncbi:hypothetical protein D3C71_1464690 [compost metagenome]
MLRYTNGTYVLVLFQLDTAHEFESDFLDQYDLNDQYVVQVHLGSQASQIKSNLMQTGSYDLQNQFQSTVKFVHHKILQQSKLTLGHAQVNSCLHGTLQYEYPHVNGVRFQVLQPRDHYVQ